MAELIQDLFMDAIGARLATIQQVNGYLTDVGTNTFEGGLIEGEPTIMPSINYWDGEETTVRLHGLWESTRSVTVETYDYYMGDKEAALPVHLAREARHQLADVMVAFYRDPVTLRPDPTLGGLVENLFYTSSRLHLGKQPELWIGVLIEFMVVYHQQPGNPYTERETVILKPAPQPTRIRPLTPLVTIA